MAEEFGQAMATAEMPDEETGAAAAQAAAPAEKKAQAAAPAEKQEQEASYDVDLDYNMEWEVETEPAEPDVIIAEPQQQAQGAQGTYDEQYMDERAARAYRRFNKHLFVWLFCFIFGIYGADRFARGQTALGVMKLLTFGGLGMWYLADLIIALVKAYSGEYMNDEEIYFDILGRYI